MAYLSKIKLANGSVYDLKDAVSRAALMTLLGLDTEAELAAWTTELGEAAWFAVEGTVLGDDDDKLPTSAVVKDYVDSQIGTINKFDVVLDPNGTKDGPSLQAKAENMYKLVLVPDDKASAGTYIEWILIRSGSDPNYTYTWEKIGSTQADLTGFVSKEAEIAGVEIGDGITKSELQNALDLKAMAYAATASGETEQHTVSGVTGSVTPEGSISVTLGFDKTEMTSKGAYTPAGTLTGISDLVTDGAVDVTLKDAATATSAVVSYDSYTPAGTITLTTSAATVVSDVSFTKSDSAGAIQIEGTVSAPTLTLNETKGDFIQTVTFEAPTKAADSFTAATLTNTSKTVATEGVTAAMDTTDTEMLVFSAASTDSASLITNFNGGAFTEGAFTAGSLTFTKDRAVTSASPTAAAPTFTGAKYLLDVSEGSIDVPSAATFTGTKSDNNIVTGVTYFKQEVDTKTFTPTKSANVTFTGTAATITVTGDFDKAKVATQEFTGTASTVTVGDIVVPAISVTVTPDA